MIPFYSLVPVFGISISEQPKIYFNHRNTLISLLSNTLIETVFDELKNLCQIAHTRHRSPANFVVNLLAGLAYCLIPSKPKIPVAGTYLQA